MSYSKFLTEMWGKHLAPREANAPTVISTFAGCGGSSLGYSMAGYKELLAVEWEDNAVSCFRENFHDVPIVQMDIKTITSDEILKRTKLSPGELDIFDGSPPCQGFSTTGKRKFEDDRNSLFREYVRLVRELRPKIIVMENVSGMVKGKMKLIFAEILKELKNCGYSVKASLLNASYFNVPQARERIFFIGTRNDLNLPVSFPTVTSNQMSVEYAIQGAPVITTMAAHKKYFADMSRLAPGQNLANLLKQNAFFSSSRVHKTKPSQTICKTVSVGGGGMWHFSENRSLSIEELKRLGSFPDEFTLLGSYAEQYARIGNSVPPLMMYAIAKHIKEKMLSL